MICITGHLLTHFSFLKLFPSSEIIRRRKILIEELAHKLKFKSMFNVYQTFRNGREARESENIGP